MRFNNKIIFVAIVSMVSLFIITLHSCNPLGSNTDSTYSLTGRMLKDCSGEPYKNYSLTFYIPGDGMITKKTVLGTVNTDEKGYFKLSNIPSNKSANINLQHVIDANYVTTWGEIRFADSANIYEDGAIYDLGDFYGEYTKNFISKITIDSSFTLTGDTLYIGSHYSDFQTIHPIPTSYLYKKSTNSYHTRISDIKNKQTYFSWGIGKAFFVSLFNSNTPEELRRKHEFQVRFETCTYPDTTYYNIP